MGFPVEWKKRAKEPRKNKVTEGACSLHRIIGKWVKIPYGPAAVKAESYFRFAEAKATGKPGRRNKMLKLESEDLPYVKECSM